jgi:Excreted virulence factor EspC, type VII ESX diderm
VPPPSAQEVAVATGTLRSEAGVWDHESGQLQAITTKAEGLRMNRLEAGIFQLMVSAYEKVVEQVQNRCGEGRQRMSEVASTLRQVADTYDREDRDREHAIRNLY